MKVAPRGRRPNLAQSQDRTTTIHRAVDADPLSVLGLDPSATYEEARQAYRRRSRLLHPDPHPDADEELRQEAERAMTALNRAWQTVEPLLK